MDVTSYEYKPETNRRGPLSVLYHTLQGMFIRLIAFFTLTEEDRLQAGVYVRGKGRD